MPLTMDIQIMEYVEPIEQKISLLNEILSDLNAPPIFENADFSIDSLSAEFYLKLNIRRENAILMDIHLSLNAIEIGLDREGEVYEWYINSIEESKAEVTTRIKQLLTGFIVVEYCGSNYTCFNVFEPDGQLLYSTPVISGLYFKNKCQKRLFLPYYSQKG